MYAALRLFKQMCAALKLFKRVSGKSVKILSRYLANYLRVTQMSKAQSQAEKEDNSMCFHFERYTRTAGAEVNMKVYIEAKSWIQSQKLLLFLPNSSSELTECNHSYLRLILHLMRSGATMLNDVLT